MALKWLIHHSKKQLPALFILTVSNALSALCGVAFALFCRGIIDNAVNHDREMLMVYTWRIAGVILLSVLLRILSNSLSERIHVRLGILYRNHILKEITQKSYHKISEYHSGELMNRLFSDADIACDGFTTILPGFALMFSKVVFALCVLIILNRDFAVIICVSGVFFLSLTALFRKKMKVLHKIVQERLGFVRSFIQESASGLLILKVFGTEKKTLTRAGELQEDYYKAQMKRRTISIFANAGFGIAFDSAYLLALLTGANGILTNTMSYGTLTAILQLIGQIQQPFANLSGLFPKYYAMVASAERLIEIERMENEPQEAPLPLSEIYQNMTAVEGNGITFSYGRNQVLENTGFRIEKGDFISIMGLSGGGKSTLFLLLMGAYTPKSGTLTLHTGFSGYPIGVATRRLFAYVPQGNYLFSGTLRENISFLSDSAAEEAIMEAAEMACIRSFIETLPDGLDTLIGERGLGLSEGQVQRIAIARAILSNAPILLLDEATSALDEKTELALLKNITSLKGKTCLIVTHRKAANQFCHRHFFLKEGKIIQS